MTNRVAEANAMRWTGRPGHYEIWYSTLNIPGKNQGLWLRYTLDAPLAGEAVPAVWASFFDRGQPKRNFALRETYPAGALRGTQGDLVAGVGEHELREGALRGRASSGGHDLAWDLSFRPAVAPVALIPPFLQPVGKIQGAGVIFPNQDVRFEGEVKIEGKKVAVKDAPGCQTHLWGRKRKDAWAWGHCNCFAGADASFEGLSVLLGRGIVVNLFFVRHEGKVYGFNAGLWWVFARSKFDVPEWTFSGRDGEARLAGVARARPEDMVQVAYLDPDGKPLFCSNCEVADLEIRLTRPGREPVVLRAEGTAHIEFTSRKESTAVRRWV